LDPCISYDALKDEFKDDADLKPFLEEARLDLNAYYIAYYRKGFAAHSPTPSADTSTQSTTPHRHSAAMPASPQKNFTACFRKPRMPIDELEEFWRLPQEDFNTCDPIQWWLGCKSSFPDLYGLVCDVLSIPGAFSFIFEFIYCLVVYLSSICCSSRKGIFRWP
jgi:hypothetical protein